MVEKFLLEEDVKKENVFQHKKILFGNFLQIKIKESVNSFFYIKISKKFANSVKRNQLKRKIKESIKHLFLPKNKTIFISFRKKHKNISFHKIFTDLKILLYKIHNT